jgi:hypothetical protein
MVNDYVHSQTQSGVRANAMSVQMDSNYNWMLPDPLTIFTPEHMLGGMISWNGTPGNFATWAAAAGSAPWPPSTTTEPSDRLEEFFW